MTATPARKEHHPGASKGQAPVWLRLAMPSVADLLFLAMFLTLTVSVGASGLLADSSTGWHIRTGEHILRTWSVPRTDPFSYTMAGQPWYAWEWLWEAVNGAVHQAFGLSGVVALTALLIAVTFALLYRTLAARSGNAIVSVLLTLAALSAASIHFLARPHVVSWLLTLFVLWNLESLERGSRRPLWALPLLFAVWANLHGGFLVGLALVAVYGAAAVFEGEYALARRFGTVLGLGMAATVLNPYGLKLHLHIARYLASHEQMNNIIEFLSPNFHHLRPQLFLVLALISLAVLLSARQACWKELLLTVAAIASALLAARNIPAASILLAYVTAPALSQCLQQSRFQRFASRGERMWEVEKALSGHLFPVVAVVVLFGSLAAGWRLPHAKWDQSRVPIGAANYLVNQLGVRDHVFSLDSWGGYLIYSYADQGFRVAVDDRSDLYGNLRFGQYREMANRGPHWRRLMADWQIRYALVPTDSGLRCLLSAASDWRETYSDKTATVFVRSDGGAR